MRSAKVREACERIARLVLRPHLASDPEDALAGLLESLAMLAGRHTVTIGMPGEDTRVRRALSAEEVHPDHDARQRGMRAAFDGLTTRGADASVIAMFVEARARCQLGRLLTAEELIGVSDGLRAVASEIVGRAAAARRDL